MKSMGSPKRSLAGPLFLVPSLLGVGLFVLLPFADVVRRSVTAPTSGGAMTLKNYQTVLSNQAFRLALGNTVRFLAICIPLLLLLSLLVALLLHTMGEAAGIWRTAFLIPMATPVASVVLLWQVLFHKAGLVNSLLDRLDMGPVRWMDSSAAFWVLVGSFIWKNMGWSVILWLAGLAGIPQSLYEAAHIDGAGKSNCFWHITLPCLLPSLSTLLLINLMNAFKVFREAYLIAGDYPHQSIYLLQHLFGNWFRELSMEKLCAAAVLVAAGCLVLCLALGRVGKEV